MIKCGEGPFHWPIKPPLHALRILFIRRVNCVDYYASCFSNLPNAFSLLLHHVQFLLIVVTWTKWFSSIRSAMGQGTVARPKVFVLWSQQSKWCTIFFFTSCWEFPQDIPDPFNATLKMRSWLSRLISKSLGLWFPHSTFDLTKSWAWLIRIILKVYFSMSNLDLWSLTLNSDHQYLI